MNEKNYKLILNATERTGVYVVREDDHRVLYFNDYVAQIAPDIREGTVCSEAWKGGCGCCPLIGIGNKRTNQTFNYDGPNHCPTDIVATRVLWDDEIPAFVITFMPHAETAASTYEKIVKGNLTTDECETIEMQSAERALLPPEGFTLTQALNTFASSRFLWPEDRERFCTFSDLANMSRELHRKKRTLVCNYRRMTPNGYRWNSMEVVPDINYTEDNQSVMIYVKDMDEHIRAELEHAAIIGSLSSMFCSSGYINLEDGTVRRILLQDNSGSVLGDVENGTDVLNDYVKYFVHPDDRAECMQVLNRKYLMDTLTPEHPSLAVEYQELPQNGGEGRWLRTTLMLTETDGMLPRSALYVAQDITESKRREMQSRKVLQDAFEAANSANASKSEFLSRMSHDIRTPLNAIIGMTAIAGTHIDDRDRVLSCLSKITVSGRHLLALINEVLDLSKIESGKLDFAEEDFSLSKLMEDLLTVIMPSVQARGQELNVRLFHLEHEDVVGDTLRLQQVFTNILSNAVKYTQKGGKIEMELRELPSKIHGYGYYEFVFRDNGIGMTPEYQKHIFEPFSRERTSQTDHIEGTGLGLAIARNIVQMMSGDIRVKSEVGVGSEFTVSLFLKLQSTQAMDLRELEDLRVLVADDDQYSCEATCLLLKEIGMVGDGVYSGQDAVRHVEAAHQKAEDYFAVILDWKMPGMDGLETARQIRSVVGPDVPIVILSAYDWSAIEQEAREAGVDGFISKPLFKSRLVYLFKQFVGSEERQKRETENLTHLEQRDFSGKRILLAEDNEMNREIAVSIIGMTGVEIECAVNGQEAVEKFRKSPVGYYDLIFMDIRMPVMNGHQAAAAIRALPRDDAQTVPIIAMTADAFASDVLASRQAGMNEHITKPLDFAVLTKCMEHWLNR